MRCVLAGVGSHCRYAAWSANLNVGGRISNARVARALTQIIRVASPTTLDARIEYYHNSFTHIRLHRIDCMRNTLYSILPQIKTRHLFPLHPPAGSPSPSRCGEAGRTGRCTINGSDLTMSLPRRRWPFDSTPRSSASANWRQCRRINL